MTVMHRVLIARRAERELARIPKDIQQRIADAIPPLAEDPVHARSGLDVARLEGGKNTWRLRVGNYRILYEVEPESIKMTRVVHRSIAY